MNEFRMGLLKDRAAAIRPDLDRAREITQKAENERRDLTPEEQAIVEPTSPGAPSRGSCGRPLGAAACDNYLNAEGCSRPATQAG
jgi:hypothetical protein